MKITFLTAVVLSITGCAHYPPGTFVLLGTSHRPDAPWSPPQKAMDEMNSFDSDAVNSPASKAKGVPAVPAEFLNRLPSLSLSDIVNIALRNSNQTRQAWAQARAAAAQYAASRGPLLPSITASMSADKQKSVVAGGKISFDSRVYSANAAVSWLLFDCGGRVASIDETREALLAANWSHSAAIQNVVLQVEQAFYDYFASKALSKAQQVSLDEAKANLAAAEQRNKAGLSTIADVLQARTALSQALLSLESFDAQIMTTRGALATAMGLPANTEFDADITVGVPPLDAAKKSITDYLETALRRRPDLAAARAQARAAEAHIRSVRAHGLPSISGSGSIGSLFFDNLKKGNGINDLSITLTVPVFSGFSRYNDVLAARAQADAVMSAAENFRDFVVLQVWTDFYNLQRSERMVRASDDLLASASKNQEVASGRYLAGVGTILDLLTAQAGLESARAQQIQARAEWWEAASRLAHDTGKLSIGTSGPP